MYFDALITNMIVKIGANLIFMMKSSKNHKNHGFFSVYLSYYVKYKKIFQIKVVDHIEIHIFCFKYFFLRVMFPRKTEIISIVFQFRKREKTRTSVEGGGVLCFIGVYSSLEKVKNGGFGRGGRGAFFHCDIYSSLEEGAGILFFHWNLFQFGKCKKRWLR